MITQNNLKEYFDNLTAKDISEAIDSNVDYIGCYINGYGYVYAIPMDANDCEEDLLSMGGFQCDKDDFLRLFMESGSLNPFLLKLI
tara:strand:+ start:1036 stop:1293 length:258 start_codon:yes stop_codon:yes gene_type:complete